MRNQKRRLKKGYYNPKNTLYVNANLIYSEALGRIRTHKWKRNIKTGNVLQKLIDSGYVLYSSTLTGTEVIKRLIEEENLPEKKATKIYQAIMEDHKFLQIASIHKILTDAFLTHSYKSRLDMKDAMHLEIAKRYKLTVVTHDKKAIKHISTHQEKKKFYPKIFKPEELIKKD